MVMAVKEPESMDDLVYFTKRAIGTGAVRAWVYREKCPACGKALMGKPKDASGKVKVRASEYVCEACGHSVEKKAYEATLTASITYTCPACGTEGETEIPYRRKKVQGVDALVFPCAKCGEKILVSKKMKDPKA